MDEKYIFFGTVASNMEYGQGVVFTCKIGAIEFAASDGVSYAVVVGTLAKIDSVGDANIC